MNEERAERWAEGWAVGGATAWAAIAVMARMGIARMGVIELLFLFGPLVIVPLGMELGRMNGGGSRIDEAAQILQPVGAVAAVVAMWLPPGRRAGIAALGWMVVCSIAALGGVLELGRELADRSVHPTRLAIAAARMDLAVGGAWLVASRWGMRPMGIQEPIGLLTAVHFHFAGFATAMIAGSALRFAEKRGTQVWLRRLVCVVIGMPIVVAVGFVISPVVKMVAAVAFSASVVGLAGYLFRLAGRARPPARGLLRGAGGAVLLSMGLAGAYAILDFMGSERLTIPGMASTHGVLNAVGFCLLGLLGWLVEFQEGAS